MGGRSSAPWFGRSPCEEVYLRPRKALGLATARRSQFLRNGNPEIFQNFYAELYRLLNN